MPEKTWNIEKNLKNNRWYLNISEALPIKNYPTLDSLKAKAEKIGINKLFILTDELLERNIEKANMIPGEEFSFPIVIQPTFDVRIIISPDKTKASLYIRKASDKNTSIDLKLISGVINNSRLKHLNHEKIKMAINSFRTSEAMELSDLVIAEGTPPSRGKDRKLTPIVEWLETEHAQALKNRVTAPVENSRTNTEKNSLTPQNASKLALVEKGKILFEFKATKPGTKGIDVFGKEIPGLPGNDPTLELVSNITLGSEGLRADCSGLLYSEITEDKVKAGIVPFRDASATIVIEKNNMAVTLILEREEGPGLPLSLDLATEALKEKEVKGAINTDLIKQAISRVKETGKKAEIIVLRGDPPVLPKGIQIVMLTEPSLLNTPPVVLAGDRILSIKRVPQGSDGHDVFGNILLASSAEQVAEPTHDDSIARETTDGQTFFTARVSGELIINYNKYSISNTKNITIDIDEKFGDISFPGNLLITGNITSGRSVKAGEKLTVTGSAGAALAYAEDSVAIDGGIKGAGRGTVWAKREIHIGFAENARILAGQTIHIDKFCFQCTVKTNHQLIMKKNPGVLLGGNIRATKGVEVIELGSAKTIRTSISFGQNYLVSDKIEVSERELEKIKDVIIKVDAEMEKTSPTSPRIHELRRKKLELLKRNEKLTVRVFSLKEQFETHYLSHIRVEKTVYPGVILESHGRYYEVRKPMHHVIFIFDQSSGQIVCSPIPSTIPNQE